MLVLRHLPPMSYDRHMDFFPNWSKNFTFDIFTTPYRYVQDHSSIPSLQNLKLFEDLEGGTKINYHFKVIALFNCKLISKNSRCQITHFVPLAKTLNHFKIYRLVRVQAFELAYSRYTYVGQGAKYFSHPVQFNKRMSFLVQVHEKITGCKNLELSFEFW